MSSHAEYVNNETAPSHLSPSATALTPTWGRPKSPLPPHRLAKLANALGVSTPVPAVHHPNAPISRSFSDTSTLPDHFRRSPTPSLPATQLNAPASSMSKYLLHVIPPLHLPHDADDESDMTPPPPNASGYHTQFRRGTLVPVYSTLQSQLGAIAKEYALPSTAGLILYLVSSSKVSQSRSPTSSSVLQDDPTDEPGPRLSEDIWKYLWTRVLKSEQRDDYLFPSPISPAPHVFSIPPGAQPTSFLTQGTGGKPLRPLIATNGIHGNQVSLPTRSITPAPSTPSTASDMRSGPKSGPQSSSSVSQCDTETPDTSTGSQDMDENELRANSIDLPGLSSQSIIPILAKVEFDIDQKKAMWYDPWLRSRKMNHAKRAESRMGRKYSINDEVERSENSQERQRPISLLTGRKEVTSPLPLLSPVDDRTPLSDQEASPVSPFEANPQPELATNEYEQIPESQDEDDNWSDDGDSDEGYTDEFTARVAIPSGGNDPLADVFGDDVDTWADLKASSAQNSKRQRNSQVVELALTGADLTPLPSPTPSELENLGKEEEEVQALLDQMSAPQTSVSFASAPSSPPSRRSSSPNGRKHVPPPLVLIPNGVSNDLVVPAEPSPMPSSAGSISLPYLNGSSPDITPINPNLQDDEGSDKEYHRVRSPAESEKRGGAVFDDLDLGLDPSEDFDDPNDRRRSQLLMKAQLDEIERTMAQLSPRILQVELEEEQISFASKMSPNNSMTLSPKLNSDIFPPSPNTPQRMESSTAGSTTDAPGARAAAAWPAVPFASLNESAVPSSSKVDGPPSPPRLAVNGVTTSAPKSYVPTSRYTTEISAETETRKRELEEEQGYPVMTPSLSRKPSNSTDSPVIPLSPDPFSRYSSPFDPIPGSVPSSAYWETTKMDSLDGAMQSSSSVNTRERSNSAATSRFSADSITVEEVNVKPTTRSTLMAVNTFKKLWRKSGKNASTSSITPVSRSSTQAPPSRPGRASQDGREAPPKTPTFGRFSPQPPPRISEEQSSAPQPQQLEVPNAQQLLAPQQPQQLPTPFSGRSQQAPPIVAAQMQPSRSSSTLDRLHFDQESPYPIRRSPYPSRPTSPSNPSPRLPDANLPVPDVPPLSVSPTNAPAPPEKDKPVRKSILKSWKTASSSNIPAQATSSFPEPRASLERPNGTGATRGKRPSVLNFGSTRSSVTSPDIPPSPPVPPKYIDERSDRRQSVRSRLTSSSIDSTHSPPASKTLHGRSASSQRSVASSRSSQETRPSFDVSQFEIVPPKMNSTLTYPYHELDHQ